MRQQTPFMRKTNFSSQPRGAQRNSSTELRDLEDDGEAMEMSNALRKKSPRARLVDADLPRSDIADPPAMQLQAWRCSLSACVLTTVLLPLTFIVGAHAAAHFTGFSSSVSVVRPSPPWSPTTALPPASTVPPGSTLRTQASAVPPAPRKSPSPSPQPPLKPSLQPPSQSRPFTQSPLPRPPSPPRPRNPRESPPPKPCPPLRPPDAPPPTLPPPPPPTYIDPACYARSILGHGARGCSDREVGGRCDEHVFPAEHATFGSMGSFHVCTWNCQNGPVIRCPVRSEHGMLDFARVSQSAWRDYVRVLYAVDDSTPASLLPLLPSIMHMEIVYTGLLPLRGIEHSECIHGGTHVPFRQRQPHPQYAAYYRRVVPVRAYSNGAWAEVSHCGSRIEGNSMWFYVLPGSAVFVNVGRTIAFEDHDDASDLFLGPGVPGGHLHPARDITTLPRAAAAAGYDSIQFLKHCDLACGRCAHELMLTAVSGTGACPPGLALRTGLNATRPCACQSIHGCLACASFPSQIANG